MVARGYFPAHRAEFGISLSNGIRGNLTGFSESLNKVAAFAQQGEDLIVSRLFKRRLGIEPKKHKGFYVDIGAYHPMSHSTTYLFYRYGWSGICVDVSEKSCLLFKKMRPRDHTYHCAIASEDQTSAFVSIPEISLINEARKATQTEMVKVDARSINSLLSEAGRDQPVDYLNIDVEGAELAALEGLDFDRWAPKIITVEIQEQTIESGLAHPVSRMLIDKGYVCLACAAITYCFVRSADLT